ncbi:MAG: efflux RND transporter permease subunit [Deltaproteobacteria bacterium]|nr:efflux RND transporter permease subunit [Deltaproteobacteria bacterium]
MFLSDLSIRRPVFTIIVMLVLVLFGAIGYQALGVDLMPKVDAPYVTISVIYQGADPEVVESRVLQPIEDAVSTISGVKKIIASGVESYGMIFVEFELDVSADRAAQDVRDKVAKVQRDLPTDAELPVVEKLDIGAAPVVTLVLTGPPGESGAKVTYVADKKAKAQIQRINGVASVDLIGKQEREIHVIADPDKLRTYHLTLPDLQQAVAYGNLDVPGGRVTTKDTEVLVKTHAEATSLKQLEELVIASPGGVPVRLADIATVRDDTEEVRTIAAYNGKRALTLMVKKQSDGNTVAVSDAVMKAVRSGEVSLPPGYKLDVVQDASTFTRHAIDDVVFDLVFGAILAVAVITVFLRDWRATFISSLALPTSVIATFAFMKVMNFTTNMLTMMALSLSIGMLIDDAIVVIENIHRHLEMGKTPAQAASDGAREIGLAVLATTMSIVAVFVPVAFMKGIIGRFFFQFGMTVAFAVMVSLFVSFTLTPMASAKMLRHTTPGAISRAIGRVLDGIDHIYRAMVGWVLSHRALTILVGVGALVFSIFLARWIPTEFTPAQDQGEIDIVFTMPEGTSLESTYQRGEELRKYAQATVSEFKYSLVLIGTGQRQKVNEGKVFLKLSSSKERKRTLEQISADLRKGLESKFPGEDIGVNKASIVGNAGGDMMAKPLNVQLRGDDSNQLRVSALKLIDALKKRGQFVDLTISDRGSRPQFGFSIDRDRVSSAGLMPAQVALAVRTAINGTEVSQFREGSDRYKIVVKAPDRYRRDRKAVLGMPLRGPMGNLVEIGELVRSVPEQAAAQIDREDRVRQVTIAANLSDLALGPAQEVVKDVAKGIVPAGVEMKFTGQAQIMNESFGYMISALILAIIIIYMVLASQFESFLHPFTIMVSLPLSLVGALGALLLMRQTLSIMAFIGVIMLMGLVTKNAILLVDNANQRMAEGKSVREAMIMAGTARLRPILMTTGAMIFGMLPVALGMGEGSEMRVGMGVTVIGGLVTSTMLTLLVVPAIYSAFENARQRLRTLLSLKARADAPAPAE